MRLGMDEIVKALDGHLLQKAELFPDLEIDSVVYDSRKVGPGSLFACIKGERTDGHLHAGSAVEAGAILVLAERELPALSVPVLVVRDTVRALMALAGYARTKTQARVVGLTGTCGKTTLKEMLADILAQAGKTARSAANHNNQLGMSVGILNTDGDEDFWVFEAGISHPDDMDELGAMLRPDLALVLNVGEGHTEFLGDKGVAWYKTRLLLHLAEGGMAVVSADYPDLVWKAMGTHVSPLIFFSAHEGVPHEGDKSANYARWMGDTDGRGNYTLCLKGECFELTAPVVGEYGAEDVAAAATCASLLGLSHQQIRQGLLETSLPSQRFNRIAAGPLLVIDDSYNANPLSMQRMLRAARDKSLPFVCVLGEMRELGKDSHLLHQRLGEEVAALDPRAVFWKGGEYEAFSSGLERAGYTGYLKHFTEAGEVSNELLGIRREAEDKIVVLVKGSRANALERVVSRLVEDFSPGEAHVL